MNGENAKIWKVTRFCCTSGMCLTCRAGGDTSKRKRIVHASNVTKEYADRCVIGWPSYGAKTEKM